MFGDSQDGMNCGLFFAFFSLLISIFGTLTLGARLWSLHSLQSGRLGALRRVRHRHVFCPCFISSGNAVWSGLGLLEIKLELIPGQPRWT